MNVSWLTDSFLRANSVLSGAPLPSDKAAFFKECDEQAGGNTLVGPLKIEAQLTDIEKLLLYTLVCNLVPSKILEIGFYCGGSSLLILEALEAMRWINKGEYRIVSMDYSPSYIPEVLARHDNFFLLSKASPYYLKDAISLLRGVPDFVFIDGNHEQLAIDLAGLLPLVDKHTKILIHDMHYDKCKIAVRDFLLNNPSWNYLSLYNTITRDNAYCGMGLLFSDNDLGNVADISS